MKAMVVGRTKELDQVYAMERRLREQGHQVFSWWEHWMAALGLGIGDGVGVAKAAEASFGGKEVRMLHDAWVHLAARVVDLIVLVGRPGKGSWALARYALSWGVRVVRLIGDVVHEVAEGDVWSRRVGPGDPTEGVVVDGPAEGGAADEASTS